MRDTQFAEELSSVFYRSLRFLFSDTSKFRSKDLYFNRSPSVADVMLTRDVSNSTKNLLMILYLINLEYYSNTSDGIEFEDDYTY